MDNRFRLLIAAVFGLLSAGANAGYAVASQPAQYVPMPSAAPVAGWGHVTAANDAVMGGSVRTNTVVNVGGRAVNMPAAYRFAANAPRFAAAAIFANPYVRFGLLAASWLGAAKIIYDQTDGLWKKITDEELSQYLYHTDAWGSSYAPFQNHSSPESLCRAFFNNERPGYSDWSVIRSGPNDCFARGYRAPAGWINVKAQITKTPRRCPVPLTNGKCIVAGEPQPLTKEQFERELAPEVWRPESPNIVPERFHEAVPPGTVLPVRVPVINPRNVPLPDEVPSPNPRFVPTGDPVKNPNYDPNSPTSPQNQPYIQPGFRIVPSPTLGEPWRVDVQPVTRPQPHAQPKPDQELNDPEKENNDKPKPEEQQDLCEKHPDIIACQKLDQPEDPGKLPVKEVDFNMTPVSGFGGAAACPAPVLANLNGRQYGFSWQPFCNSLDMIKPLLLAFAWLSAAFIMLGVKSE